MHGSRGCATGVIASACAAVVRYSAPGIRPGGRPFFLLAKRKKAKKALQFNTMVVYTSSITKAADHSPARRAQTEAYLKAQNTPSICRLRRLQVQATGHTAGAKAPAARRSLCIASPAAAFAAPLTGSSHCLPGGACLSPPGGRVDTLREHRRRVNRHRNCFSRLFFADFLF